MSRAKIEPGEARKEGWRRNIFVFLASQAISLLGSSLVQYSIIWHITLETKSGSVMTLMILVGFLPAFFLSPFAGVFADRHSRKKIIMIADASIALATLVLAFVYRAGFEALWLLLLVSSIRSAGQAFHGPAVGAILPQMVPAESLLRINALSGTIQSTLAFISPMLAGALLSFVPFPAIFFIDVVTAALAILILGLLLRVPAHAKAAGPRTTGYFEDLKSGFRYVRRHRYLAGFFVYISLLLVLITPSAFLTPLQTVRSYGEEVWRLTGIEVAFSLGMMAGGSLLAALGGFRNRMATIIASTFIMAVCAALFGFTPPFWVYLGLMGVFGVAMVYFNTPFSTMLQEHVEEDFMGRVFSILAMIQSSVMPLGMLVFGPLGDLVKVESILIGTGALIAVIGVGAFMNRGLMEMGVPVAPSPESALP